MAGKVIVRNLAYFDRRVQQKEIREAGASGVREIRTCWIDDADERNGGYPAGTVVSRTIKGNFFRGTGEVLVAEHVVEEF